GITLWPFPTHGKWHIDVEGKIVLHKGKTRIDGQDGTRSSEPIVPPDDVLDGNPLITGAQGGGNHLTDGITGPGAQGELVGHGRDGLIGQIFAQGFPKGPYPIGLPGVDQIEPTAVSKEFIGQFLVELEVQGEPKSAVTRLNALVHRPDLRASLGSYIIEYIRGVEVPRGQFDPQA